MQWMQRKKVAVAADDRVRLTRKGDIKELVIARVATNLQVPQNGHESRHTAQQGNEPLAILATDVGVELRPAKDGNHLFQRRLRERKDPSGEGKVGSTCCDTA